MGQYITPHDLEKKLKKHELEKKLLGFDPPNAPLTVKSKGEEAQSEMDTTNVWSSLFDPREGMPITYVLRSQIQNHRLVA